MKKRILVPTDFTKVGDTALNHATVIGRALDAEVHVLHVIANKKEISEAKLKLETLQARVKSEFDYDINTIVRIGSIYEDIDEVAVEISANLIVMGTHGLRGMQFITGSKALRIVTESVVPFIIVQEREIRATGYDRIVVPLDLEKDTKQKLAVAADMAIYFDSEVFLISPGETDEFLHNQLMRNINFAQDYFKERDIKFNVEISESKGGGFVKAMLHYATSINADLITIMNFYENSLMNIIGGGYEQQIITNEGQVPVLCVNPVHTHFEEYHIFGM